MSRDTRTVSEPAPETHGKQGISLHDTPRSVDSIEVPATEMVLDLKQIVSSHIVEVDTHTLDTAVERVEKSIFPRSLDQNASYEELARELSKCSPLESRVLLETLSEHTERPISNRATSVQPAAVVSKQQEDLARWFHPDRCSMNDSVQGDWTGRGRLKGNTLAWCKAQLSGPVVRLDQRVHRPKVPTAIPDMGLWFNPQAGDSDPNVDLQCRWALADRFTVMASDDQGRKQGLLRQCDSRLGNNNSRDFI